MIEASFTERGGRYSLFVNGHAGYAESGRDIVCAAVSGLVCALAGYIHNECDGARIYALGSGIASLECGEDGLDAMRMAYIGLLQLALTYPGFVAVKGDANMARRAKGF